MGTDVAAAVSMELRRLEAAPAASPGERAVAQRALVRYEKPGACDVDSVLSTTEEWVRLYIALRRVNPPGTRLTAKVLTQWNGIMSDSS